MPKTRLGWFLFGVLLIVAGFLIYSEKGWTIMRGSPTHHTLGYVFLIGGLIYCFFAIYKKEFPKELPMKSVICTSCLNPCYEKDLINGFCPKCNGIVDDLLGFLDRHPELKKGKRT